MASIYDDLKSGARASVRGTGIDGDDLGLFQPIRDDSGEIGWQAVDDAGRLLGLLDARGTYGAPWDAGNRTWDLCEVTAAHIQALRRAGSPVATGEPIRWS